MGDPPSMNGSGGKNATLAALLRESADDVERNQLTPTVMQAWGVLRIYVKERGGAPTKVTTSTRHIPPPSPNRPFDEKHDDAVKASVPKDTFPASASAEFDFPASASVEFESASDDASKDSTIANKSKDHFGLGGLGKKLWGSSASSKSSQQTSAEHAQKSATSKKNAERAKSDLADLAAEAEQEVTKHRAQARDGGGYGAEDEWCEEHFTMGCGCKLRKQAAAGKVEPSSSSEEVPPTPVKLAGSTNTMSTAASTTATPATAAASQETSPSKPAFQRPVNPNSTLIANGWIEQQRRSKMRSVWKDILASLVEGRKPGEETTLWIQRQHTNPVTGKAQLEALHQIPMKWMENVKYLDFYGDHRFTVKVYNVTEEFMFRCADEDSAQNWVLTLRSVSEIAQRNSLKARVEAHEKADMGLDNLDDWDSTKESKGEEHSPSAAPSNSHKMTVRELRAIAHGAGYNTSGMERGELERLVAGIAAQMNNSQKDAAVDEQRKHQGFVAERVAAAEQKRQQEEEFRQHEEEARKHQMAEAELRARRQMDEEKRRVAAAEAEQRREALEAEHRRVEEERRRKAEEEQRRQALEAEHRRVEEERRLKAEDEQRRQALEAERKRVEEQRRWKAEEEQRRRVAEQQAAELRRRQAEEAQRKRQAEEDQRRRLAEQQAAEQRRRQEEEQRRRVAEQQAAEQRRKQEEEQRRRQQEWKAAQWQQQQASHAAANREQWNKQWHAQQQQQQQHNQHGFYGQQQGHGQQPHQPFQGSAGPPPGAHRAAPGAQPPPPHNQASPASLKYAKMKEQSDDNRASITAIKRNILMHWALQPPMLQVLRPVDVLITTIHTVFPPAFGVKGHEYFSSFSPIPRESLLLSAAMGNSPDDAKLKKAVRKLRFFLHPDKLPRDLNDEQSFMCKMLWDITSDAWEEFHKKNEELDWIRS